MDVLDLFFKKYSYKFPKGYIANAIQLLFNPEPNDKNLLIKVLLTGTSLIIVLILFVNESNVRFYYGVILVNWEEIIVVFIFAESGGYGRPCCPTKYSTLL